MEFVLSPKLNKFPTWSLTRAVELYDIRLNVWLKSNEKRKYSRTFRTTWNLKRCSCCITVGLTYPMTSVVAAISLCCQIWCKCMIELSSRHASLILYFIDLAHSIWQYILWIPLTYNTYTASSGFACKKSGVSAFAGQHRLGRKVQKERSLARLRNFDSALPNNVNGDNNTKTNVLLRISSLYLVKKFGKSHRASTMKTEL